MAIFMLIMNQIESSTEKCTVYNTTS